MPLSISICSLLYFATRVAREDPWDRLSQCLPSLPGIFRLSACFRTRWQCVVASNAMQSTLCNRVILNAVRHCTCRSTSFAKFFICMLFANSPQPQVHLANSRTLFSRPFPHIPVKPISWIQYLKSRSCYKERRENSDDEENCKIAIFLDEILILQIVKFQSA